MPPRLTVLLDQNIPRLLGGWLSGLRPTWTVHHTSDVGLEGSPDGEVFAWAQQRGAIIVTHDEDFADQRSFPVGSHHGIVRLRVWPTTIEQTQEALERLLQQVPDTDLQGALIIIDHSKIRLRVSRP